MKSFPQPECPSPTLVTVRGLPWLGLVRKVSKWSPTLVAGLLLALILVIGWIDYLTGVELSVSLLYLIPISVGTWVGGRSMGNLAALCSVAVWFGADLLLRDTYGQWFVPLWNTVTLAFSFLVVVDLLSALRRWNVHRSVTME